MNIIVLDPPAALPVSLEEIYTFLRLDPAGSPPEHPDDAMLLEMIQSATEKVEAATNRALVQRTIRLVLSEFDSKGIELKRQPFREMVAVSYLNAAAETVELDASAYYVSAYSVAPRVYPSASWPTPHAREDAVMVDYVVGYEPVDSSDLTGNIPASLKAAVKFEVQLQYDELSPEKRKQIEDTIARLIGQYRVYSF